MTYRVKMPELEVADLDTLGEALWVVAVAVERGAEAWEVWCDDRRVAMGGVSV